MNLETNTTDPPSNQPGCSTVQPTLSSSPSFNDEPLENLLDQKVHEMSPEQLAEYIKTMALLRSSAQSRRAALRSENIVKKPTAKRVKKDPVALAMEMLAKLQQKGKNSASS